MSLLVCYWVGSLDFNFLVEIKLGFPPYPQKVILFLQRGQQQQRMGVKLSMDSPLNGRERERDRERERKRNPLVDIRVQETNVHQPIARGGTQKMDSQLLMYTRVNVDGILPFLSKRMSKPK